MSLWPMHGFFVQPGTKPQRGIESRRRPFRFARTTAAAWLGTTSMPKGSTAAFGKYRKFEVTMASQRPAMAAARTCRSPGSGRSSVGTRVSYPATRQSRVARSMRPRVRCRAARSRCGSLRNSASIHSRWMSAVHFAWMASLAANCRKTSRMGAGYRTLASRRTRITGGRSPCRPPALRASDCRMTKVVSTVANGGKGRENQRLAVVAGPVGGN